MSVQDNIRLDEQFMAGWNAHSADQALSVLSDDCVWHDVTIPEPMRGKAAIRSYLQSWFTAFPDMHATVKNRVVSDDQVAAELEFTGTNKGPLQMDPNAQAIPVTGKKVNGRATYFVRIRNGKAVEIHTYPDAAGMMMQLGLMQGGSS